MNQNLTTEIISIESLLIAWCMHETGYCTCHKLLKSIKHLLRWKLLGCSKARFSLFESHPVNGLVVQKNRQTFNGLCWRELGELSEWQEILHRIYLYSGWHCGILGVQEAEERGTFVHWNGVHGAQRSNQGGYLPTQFSFGFRFRHFDRNKRTLWQ